MRKAVNHWLMRAWFKPIVCALGLLPLAWLVFATAFEQLGANPAEALVRSTGDWALRMLCLTLAVTPLRNMLHIPALLRFRRTLGLLTYTYAVLHLLCYSWFDMGLDIADIAKDIAKRPFILVGFMAWLLLTPLALTSFNRAVRWLGGKNWQLLHRIVYPIALLALLHFFWMRAGKQNFAEVSVYALVIALLLGWRIYHKYAR